MPLTYQLIASSTLSSPTTTFTFSSIPNTYTDLVVKTNLRSGSPNGSNLRFFINGNNSAVYGVTYLWAFGSSSGSGRTTPPNANTTFTLIPDISAANFAANAFASTEIYIPNYTLSSNRQVSFIQFAENNSASVSAITSGGGLIQIASPVTSISLQDSNDSFVANSSFYLYGIKNS